MRTTTIRRHAQLRQLADELIARHYREPLTVAMLARRLGTSPRVLQRAYAQTGRTTVAEQLRAARLQAGAELLAEQSIAVADVGRLVGFRSASAFAAAFARRFGLAPAAYRTAARAARARSAPPVGAGRPGARSARPITRSRTAATGPGR